MRLLERGGAFTARHRPPLLSVRQIPFRVFSSIILNTQTPLVC